MKKEFYSNGKLLITSEYLVLDGAEALALPTKFGQYLTVEATQNPKSIEWTSFDSDESIWFQSNIDFEDIIKENKFEHDKIKTTLVEILHHAYLLNPNFLIENNGYNIETKLTFPKNWGLGTSSTLINNISQWLEIDAFTLLKNSFGGSGYDIACAQHCTPILYKLVNEKPLIKEINFNPNFKNNIYFVYLNQKQNSRDAIRNYLSKRGDIQKVLQIFNSFTETISNTDNYEVFKNTLSLHEIELSNILETQTIKESFFLDFDGVIKSLGAWGGDFVLVVSDTNPTKYFKSKGFDTILSYEEMILS